MRLASMPSAWHRSVGAYAAGAAVGLGCVGAALSVAGVEHSTVGVLTLVFLVIAPATAVSRLVGGDRIARVIAGVSGAIVVNAVVAEAMLVFGVWSPRGGVATVAAVSAAVLGIWLITATGTRGASRGAGHRRPSR